MPLAHITLDDSAAQAAVTLAGGCLTAYRVDGLDILRPPAAAPDDNAEDGDAAADPRDTACFPLLPYSNRIRDGRFRFAGTEHQLPRNFPGHPHSIHGVGWQAAWRLIGRDKHRVELALDYDGDGWPFPFAGRQSVALEDGDLVHTLEMTNRADRPMPVGLGLHPYFPRHGGARLQASVSHVWRTDATCLPTERVPCPAPWDLVAGADVETLHCDNQFEPWDGRADITWPADGMAVTLTAGGGLDRLCVYAPAGQDFFCVEPISHITDAFNRGADGASQAATGMRVLEPGEIWRVWQRLSPRRI